MTILFVLAQIPLLSFAEVNTGQPRECTSEITITATSDGRTESMVNGSPVVIPVGSVTTLRGGLFGSKFFSRYALPFTKSYYNFNTPAFNFGLKSCLLLLQSPLQLHVTLGVFRI